MLITKMALNKFLGKFTLSPEEIKIIINGYGNERVIDHEVESKVPMLRKELDRRMENFIESNDVNITPLEVEIQLNKEFWYKAKIELSPVITTETVYMLGDSLLIGLLLLKQSTMLYWINDEPVFEGNSIENKEYIPEWLVKRANYFGSGPHFLRFWDLVISKDYRDISSMETKAPEGYHPEKEGHLNRTEMIRLSNNLCYVKDRGSTHLITDTLLKENDSINNFFTHDYQKCHVLLPEMEERFRKLLKERSSRISIHF